MYFKPRGVSMSELEEILVEEDEIEALRLSDVDGLDQTSAAKRMKISQPTFARILASARNKLASAIVNGSAIRLGDSSKEKVSN
ncbi:MAG: hypothetical protein AUJ19_04560 [Parcubacteria group bacterium CG1_02_58_44]|nr:MAG: hypothetical protein AUJ19_04560 [Parcubacteria group bacterium CG1_02_58_44]